MKPSEWTEQLGGLQRWQDAYEIVEREAKAFLDKLTVSAAFSTSELVEHLFPAQYVKSDAAERARNWIFKGLIASKNPWRARYAVQGAMRTTGINKGSRPWLWGAPREPASASTCPTCGQEMF